MDIKAIALVAAEAAADALDKQIPDGLKQQFIGNFLEAFGTGLAEAGRQLAGAQNKDGDA